MEKKQHFKWVSEELQLTWTPEKKKLHKTTKYLASVESPGGFKKSEDKLLC